MYSTKIKYAVKSQSSFLKDKMSSTLILKPQAETKFEGTAFSQLGAVTFGGTSELANRMPDVEDQVWTYPRENLPPQFIGSGVSLELWQRTWDLVYERVDADIKCQKEIISSHLEKVVFFGSNRKRIRKN